MYPNFFFFTLCGLFVSDEKKEQKKRKNRERKKLEKIEYV